MEDIRAGLVLDDTYTVVSKLGEGAFSEVFLVRHRFLGLQAMKIFKAGSVSPDNCEFNEAFLLSRIGHPNVIRIFEANVLVTSDGQRPYLTMEYISDGTLSEFLSNSQPLSLSVAVDIEKQICSGLSSAHNQAPPMVHRDLKPQNVLVRKSKNHFSVKIADFGLAKVMDPNVRMASAAGTLVYMPPEGFRHYETPASDVYCAGIIFYEMLTGTFPFRRIQCEDEKEFKLQLARSRAAIPVPPSQFRKEIPPNLDQLCLKALEPDISKRFQTAMELEKALEDLDRHSVHPKVSEQKDAEEPRYKARRALDLGKQFAELPYAIKLLETALREDPTLRDEYGNILKRWKSGVVY